MVMAKTNSTTRTSSLHPPYFQMIAEAITTMKDRTGLSQPSIAKFMAENYAKQLPPNFKKILSVQLKRFVESEKLVKVKNSYKLFPEIKNVTKQSYKAEKTPKDDETEKNNVVKKARKSKRLSQVKTPDGFKNAKAKRSKK